MSDKDTQAIESWFTELDSLFGDFIADGDLTVEEYVPTIKALSLEMAAPWSKIEKTLEHGTDERHWHLLKLYYFRKYTRYLHGWKNTVFNSCFAVVKKKNNKGKDRFPSEPEIYQVVFGHLEDVFQDRVSVYVSAFNDKTNPSYVELAKVVRDNAKDVLEYMKEYHHWLALNLAIRGQVESEDVSREVDRLLKAHPYTL
jgi:hypothetical protein